MDEDEANADYSYSMQFDFAFIDQCPIRHHPVAGLYTRPLLSKKFPYTTDQSVSRPITVLSVSTTYRSNTEFKVRLYNVVSVCYTGMSRVVVE